MTIQAPDPRSLISRVSVVVGGLAVCSGCGEVNTAELDTHAPITLVTFLGVAIALLVGFSWLAIHATWRSNRRRLVKILVVTLAGGVCGTLWVVLITTALDGARPGALTEGPLAAAGVVVALGVAVLLSGPGRLKEVVGRSLMAVGFNSLALPVAVLISFLVGGARLSPDESARPELSAVILGVGLAGDVVAVGLSIGGLLCGVLLVFLGERLLARARRGRADGGGTPFIRGHFQS